MISQPNTDIDMRATHTRIGSTTGFPRDLPRKYLEQRLSNHTLPDFKFIFIPYIKTSSMSSIMEERALTTLLYSVLFTSPTQCDVVIFSLLDYSMGNDTGSW